MEGYILENSWILYALVVWQIPWKGVALWKSARYSHKKWFIALLLLQTLAILDILYIFVFSKKRSGENKISGSHAKGHITNIEKDSLENENFRKVLYTAKNSQLVLMSLEPGKDIGEEVHELDQFIRCESGEGKAVLNGVEHKISDGFAVLVPAGAMHNIINTSSENPLKLYTIYSPPEHRDGIMHATKEEAAEDEEHFDGKTTE